MNTQSFDAFIPRLRSLEGELTEIRRDLVCAIHESHKREAPEPEPAREPAPTAPSAVEPAPNVESPFPPAPRPTYASAGRGYPTAGPATSTWEWPSFEQLVGGKALNLAGLLLVFLGSGFFLKLAFDNNWIAPPERVAMGLIVGIGLTIYAQFLAKRDLPYFSDGLTALGAALEFLSLYAAGPFFHLISPAGVFVGMIAVSASLTALGWRHRSERLGILGAVAGFLSPLLIGTTQSNEWMLAIYLAAFVSSLLVLGELLESKIIAPLALFGTLCYGALYFYGAPVSMNERVEIFALFYATFAVAGWIVTRLRANVDPVRTTIACVTLGSFVLGLFGLLNDSERTLLAEILFALAAMHVAAAAVLRSRYQGWLAGISLTLAIPVEFHGAALAASWALEATALVYIGLGSRDRVLHVGGMTLLGVDMLLAFCQNVQFVANNPIWNERFITLASLVVASAAINWLFHYRSEKNVMETALRIATHAIGLWMLTAETWDYASSGALHLFGVQAGNVAVSILWTLFATVLIGSGLRKSDALLRWEGLALIVVAIAKVLLFDLSSLDFAYRVLSGIIVGIVLIAVSYAYQRRVLSKQDAA